MLGEYTDTGIPEKIKIYKDFQQLRIVRKWFGYKYILFAAVAIFWDALVIGFYIMVFSSYLQGHFGIEGFLLPLFHVFAGVCLTYYALMGFVNETVIEVDFNSITVRHGPLPFWGNIRIASKKITQIYCKRVRAWESRYYDRTYSFTIRAITSDRRNIKLVTGLDTSEQALFIEQEVERFLKIEDKRVKGEIR